MTISAPLSASLSRCKTWAVFALLLCVVSGLLFAPVTQMGFAEHDAETIRDNARISGDPGYFFSLQKAQVTGRPVAELAKWVAFLLSGDDPRLLHIAAIALHTLAALLLAAVLRQTQTEWTVSAMASSLFLAHIGHFYAVYHISAMDYTLALVLALAGMACYVRHGASGDSKWLVGATAFLGAGALSHIAVVAAWPFCTVWSLLRGGDRRRMVRSAGLLGAVLAVAVAVALVLTPRHTNTARALDGPLAEVASLDFVAGLAQQLFWFTGKLLTASHVLTPFWHGRETWELYIGAGLVLLLLVLAWRRIKLPAVWSAWTLTALLPFVLIDDDAVLGWPEVMSRYLYLASAGSSVLIACGLHRLCLRLGGRAVVYLAMAALMLSSYAGLRAVDNYYSYRAGFYLWVEGDRRAGIAQVQRALDRGREMLPVGSLYFRLCNMILSVGDPVDSTLTAARAARPDDDRLLILQYAVDSLRPDVAVAGQGRQAIAAELDRNSAIGPEAEARFRQIAATVYRFIGHGHYGRSEWSQAIAAYGVAARLSATSFDIGTYVDNYAHALTRAGIALAQRGDYEAAIEYFRQATTVKPNVSAHFNMGRALKERRELNAAAQSYRQGLALDPDNVAVLNSLGVVELESGRVAAAVELFQRVVAIDPDYAPARQNLAAVAKSVAEP